MKLSSPKAADILPEPPPIPTIDLARLLNKPPPDGLIELPSGVFRIRCDGMANRSAANGLTIRGNGYQRTFIQRDPNPAYAANNQPVLRFDGDDMTIEDVTLDANSPPNNPDGTPGSDYAYSCLHMFGRNSRVRGVRGLRASGVYGRMEGFSFFINSPDCSALVEDCSLLDVRGNYTEGFSVQGALIRPYIVFPALENDLHPPYFYGCLLSGTNGASIIGARQFGGTGLVYNDTGSNSNARVEGCTVIGAMEGITMTCAGDDFIDGMIIDGNIIELSPLANVDVSVGSCGVSLGGTGPKRNVRVTNNLIRYVGGVQGPAANAGRLPAVAIVGGTGSVIMGNSVDADFIYVHETSATFHANSAIARAVPAPGPTAPEK